LVFLHRNPQSEEIDGQESMGRISETPPAVRYAREARSLQLYPEFKLRRLRTTRSAHRYSSAIGLTGSCTKVKLRGREEESFDERHGHRDFGIREIGKHENEASGI
jgi:hypothetical protein